MVGVTPLERRVPKRSTPQLCVGWALLWGNGPLLGRYPTLKRTGCGTGLKDPWKGDIIHPARFHKVSKLVDIYIYTCNISSVFL